MSTESLTSQDLMILRDLIMRRPSNDKAYAVSVSMMNHDEIDAQVMRWCEDCRTSGYPPAETAEVDAYTRDPEYTA